MASGWLPIAAGWPITASMPTTSSPSAAASRPKELRRPELAAEAARLLAAAGRGNVAAELIEAALQEGWDGRLSTLYGRIDAPPYRSRIERASAGSASTPTTRRCLRRWACCASASSCGARRAAFLADSRRLAPSGETSLALARIAEATGD